MKILFCPHNYPPTPGGVSTFSHGIVESLKSKGHEVTIIYDKSMVKKTERLSEVCYFFNVKISHLKIIFKTMHVLWAFLLYKPDLIFCTEWKSYGLGSFILKKIFNATYFIQVHGTEILKLQDHSLGYFLSKIILDNAKGIIPNSKYTSKLLSKLNCDKNKIHIFHPGIFPVETQSSVRGNTNVIFFTAARLVDRKGIDLCIEALSEISNKNWEYHIAGDGPSKKTLIKLVKKKKLEDKVKFLGMIKNSEIHKYFASCDVFLTTSRNALDSLESFGIVYLEANLHGKPVIASSVGGVPDAVIDNETGFLIEENNKEQLKNKLNIMMIDEKLRKRLGQQGKERVLKTFLWNTHINRLIEILKRN